MSVETPEPRPIGTEPEFDDHLRRALAQLRVSLADILATVGANLRVPHQITRQFGIDKSLASKLARVVRENDPYSAALDVPGEEAMRIFSRAMRDAGAPQASLESLRQSVESFQQMIRTHCGDRATLEMIASSASPARSSKQQQQIETLRKHMFRGASAVFGVQTRLQLSAHVVAPSQTADRYDVALFNGLVDFRRIRADVAWAVSSMRNIAPDGSPRPPGTYESIDPAASDTDDGPLIREFCSNTGIALRTTPGTNSTLRFELPEGPVGSTHSQTIFTGWIHRAVGSRFRTPDDHVGEHFTMLTTPAELTIQDMFVHRELVFARRPTVHLYGQLPGAVAYPNGPRERGLLPMAETLQELSGLPPQPMTPEHPNYPAIVERVIQRLGHRIDDFYGFRIQLRFPPIPSMVLYRYDLPARPES